MSNLSDSQLVVLSAACQRADRNVLPLPAKLKGGAAGKVVNSLLAKGLIKEVRAKRDEPVWRTDEDRGRIALRATRAAFDALGIDPTDAGSDDGTERADEVDAKSVRVEDLYASDNPIAKANAESWNAIPGVRVAGKRAAAKAKQKAKAARPTGEGDARPTKQAQLIAMLKRPEGATIDEIVQAFGWLPHTARAAIAGALKKKLGLDVRSDKVEHRGRVYRVTC